MFSIFKSKASSPAANFFPIAADMHSHILPGIDDGSPNAETSLALIEGMMKLGITSAVATPHIIGDIYRNNGETISNALIIVQNALAEKGIDFKIKAAAEYMLDDYFIGLLRAKTPLLTLSGNMVLTEFSYAERPSNIEQMVFELITEGYRPVLAHPERYSYYHNDHSKYDQLRDLGFLLQVNLLSLTGYYGKGAAKAATYMIKKGLVSFAGTDLHHARHMEAFHLPANRSLFAEAFSGKKINDEMIF